MNNSYFYLEPYAYIDCDDEKAIVYDTLSGQSLCLALSDKHLYAFVNELKNSLSKSVIFDKTFPDSVVCFVKQCRDLFMGDIWEGPQPFIAPFKPKYMNTVDVLKKNEDLVYKVIGMVSHLVIMQEGKKQDKNIVGIENPINQFLFPLCNFGGKIELSLFCGQMSKIYFDKLKTVSILGDFEDGLLQSIYKDYPGVDYCFYYQFEQFDTEWFLLHTNYIKRKHVLIWVNPQVQPIMINETKEKLRHNGVPCSFLSAVCNENDLMNVADGVVSVPFYNKTNIGLFKKNVFLTERDILSQKITEEDILNNMMINSNFFGELYFMPDNRVYANPNTDSLGCFGDDWHDILYNLLDSCWFKTRDIKPCSNCAFQYLCPPPSNYEIAIGKPNLCTVKP